MSAPVGTPNPSYPFPGIQLHPPPNRKPSGAAATPALALSSSFGGASSASIASSAAAPTSASMLAPQQPVSINVNLNGLPLTTSELQTFSPRGAGPLAQSSTFGNSGESLSRSVSPFRGTGATDVNASFRSNASSVFNAPSASSNITAQQQAQHQAKTVATLNDMLQKAREGLIKLQSDVEVERQRRQTTERDLSQLKHDLSNERLANSSSAHHLQLAADKEARLLRELSLSKLVENQLRNELHEADDEKHKEKEERIRLNERVEAQAEELRTLHDTLRAKDNELSEQRDQFEKQLSTAQSELKTRAEQLHSTAAQLRDEQEQGRNKAAALQRMEADYSELANRNELSVGQYSKQSELKARELEDSKQSLQTSEARVAELKLENQRLVSLVQETAVRVSQDLENRHRDQVSVMDGRIATLSTRIEQIKNSHTSLANLLHTSSVAQATLNEKYRSMQHENARLSSDNQRLTSELNSERVNHAESDSRSATVHAEAEARNKTDREQLQQQLEEAHLRYEKDVQDLETQFANRFHQAQHAGFEEQKAVFESMLQNIRIDIERAIQSGLNGMDGSGSNLNPMSSLTDVFASPVSSRGLTASAFNAAEDGQPIINNALTSFYSASLSLFKQSLLTRLDASYSLLHSKSDKSHYDLTTQLSLLKNDLSFSKKSCDELKASEESLANRLKDLSESTNEEIKKLRSSLSNQELLLNERANTIRELKRRYKREQEQAAAAKGALQTMKSDFNSAQLTFAAEVDSLKKASAAELSSSLHHAEALAQKRLDGENKLRKKAEEESEKYVRLCQQSEERNFLMQQEKANLVSFFKQQMASIVQANTGISIGQKSTAAVHAAAAASEARLSELIHANAVQQLQLSPSAANASISTLSKSPSTSALSLSYNGINGSPSHNAGWRPSGSSSSSVYTFGL